MSKKIIASLLLLLLLFMIPTLSGAEEEAGRATPTDLESPEEEPIPPEEDPAEENPDGEESRAECPHEHTRSTIYFFDSPSYTSISATSHRVSGAATIETVCEDCGALLSSVVEDNVEEVRPHSMKNGVCALCGYRMKSAPDPLPGSRQSAPGERIITAQPDESGLFDLTLSEEDLTALTNARVKTVLVRGQSGNTVIALDVAEMKAETAENEANLSLELAEREDGSFFAGLFLSGKHGKRIPEGKGIRLRFYGENNQNTRFSVAPSDEETLSDVSADWEEDGYWSVPYVGEGTYFPLQ